MNYYYLDTKSEVFFSKKIGHQLVDTKSWAARRYL